MKIGDRIELDGSAYIVKEFTTKQQAKDSGRQGLSNFMWSNHLTGIGVARAANVTRTCRRFNQYEGGMFALDVQTEPNSNTSNTLPEHIRELQEMVTI